MLLTRSISAALFPAIAAFAVFATPSAAEADDIDCKLILCLAGGFPANCGDAHEHMIDRLRDGKSPIGTCLMSDGEEYDNYEIDYTVAGRTDPEAWVCPEGKSKHFSRSYDDRMRDVINVFCYDERRRLGYSNSSEETSYYTGVSTPEYKNMEVQITVEPGTDAEYTNGVQRYGSGITSSFGTRVIFHP